MKKQLAFLITLVCFTSTFAYAGTISVHGDAEIKITPDQVTFHINLESQNPNILLARKNNEEQAQKILALLPRFQVDPKKHIQTTFMTIAPHYEYQ